MIPNMYKISGELYPEFFMFQQDLVAHALSILMIILIFILYIGWFCNASSGGVQEVMILRNCPSCSTEKSYTLLHFLWI